MGQRMTKKERREAAKRARLEAQRRAARQRIKRRIYALLSVLGVIALIVFFVVRSQESSREQTQALNELATAAGCAPIQTHADEGRTHVPDGTPVSYQTNPPTSGNHYGATTLTGVHATAPNDGNLVHNLEHGHTIFWYQPSVSPDVVDAIEEAARADAIRRISVPRENLPEPIAFTVWGKSMTCDGSGSAEDVGAVAAEFARVEGGKGPEGDLPGQANPATGG